MKTINTYQAFVARAVALHRKKAGLSRRKLSELADVAETAIYNIETMNGSVRLDTLLRLFSVLNIKIGLEGPFMDEVTAKDEGHA